MIRRIFWASIFCFFLEAFNASFVFGKADNGLDYNWLKSVCQNYSKNESDGNSNYLYWQCDWFKKSTKNKETDNEENNRYQDLKNFMAFSQLKKAKADAEMMFLKPPDLIQTMRAGFQDEQARKMADPLKRIYQNYFSDWNILMEPGVADQNFFIKSHIENYCSQNEEKSGICLVNNEGKEGRLFELNNSREPEDLSASSLLGKNVLASKREQESASLYIRNLTNPIPVPLIGKKEMFKNVEKRVLSEDGKENLSAKFRQQTLVSLAQESFLNMLAERMPFDNLDGHSVDSTTQQASRLNVLEKEANRRFNNATWYNKMNTLSTEALLREMANMMALELAMNYRNSKRMERMEALMSAQVAYVAQLMGGAEQARQAAATVMEKGKEE